jgi:histidine ammonia-lyase
VTVTLTGSALTLDEVVRVARAGEPVELAPDARERIRLSREVVTRAIEDGGVVYGVTTGVGVRKRTSVEAVDFPEFNRRLILDHRVGQGPAAPEPVVRAQMLHLANGFARGTSGVRIEVVDRIVEALNSDATPIVRTLGSIGEADGPANADLAYSLFADFELGAKEGLALLSHSGFSTAMAALALADAQRLLDALDVAGALDLEALGANLTLLHPAVAEYRPFAGLRTELERLRGLLEGSYLWEQKAARELQDPLSFRCLPQVHGAARDAFGFAEAQLAVELNASQENPLVVVDEGRIVSAGNFDVLPLAAAIDFVRIALAPVLTTASERALKLLQEPVTGLPEGLAVERGLAENALSEFGVPLQAFAAEARLLVQPVSVEAGSTTHHEGIEDRITLAPLAARRLAEMVELGERLGAIELVLAAQAIDLRGRPQLGRGTAPAYARVREVVPPTGRGEAPPQDLEPVVALIRERALELA